MNTDTQPGPSRMATINLRSPLGFAFRLFAFTTLLCALTCFRAVGFSWGHTQGPHFHANEISLESGWLRFSRYVDDPLLHPSAAHTAERIRPHLWARIPEPLGFHDNMIKAMVAPRHEMIWLTRTAEFQTRYTLPLWPLTLLTILPALRFAGYKYTQRIQRRRLRKGCCLACGYDLRFSPSRCPECGRDVNDPRPAESLRSAA